MLGMGLTIAGRRDWNVPVVPTSSAKGEGIVDLLDAMDGHWKHLNDSGRIAERRQQINERRLLKAGEQILRDRFARHRDGKVTQLLERLQTRAMSPHAAAAELLETIRIGGEA
jgi:LAO/AO transport system kinase